MAASNMTNPTGEEILQYLLDAGEAQYPVEVKWGKGYRKVVMFKGKIVEQGSVKNVLSKPSHPYTKALLNCVPDSAGKKVLKPINYEKLFKMMAK